MRKKHYYRQRLKLLPIVGALLFAVMAYSLAFITVGEPAPLWSAYATGAFMSPLIIGFTAVLYWALADYNPLYEEEIYLREG
jgi:peptidoglycan/LPS O-acetylase OafA/YrhL